MEGRYILCGYIPTIKIADFEKEFFRALSSTQAFSNEYVLQTIMLTIGVPASFTKQIDGSLRFETKMLLILLRNRKSSEIQTYTIFWYM